MVDCSISDLDAVEFYTRLREGSSKRLALFGDIEVTPYCNMKCVHCYIANCHWDDQIMSFPEYCRIIDEAVKEGCLSLLFTGGEPFLRNDFLDMYIYAKKKGIRCSIFTNATLITPEIARTLTRYPPVKIEISIYGATAATHDSVTGVRGSYEDCLRGIELLVKQGINPTLKTIVMTLNMKEIWEMKKLAADLGLQFRFDPVIHPQLDGSRNPCKFRISPEDVIALDKADPDRAKSFTEFYQLFSGKNVHRDNVYVCGAGNLKFYIDAFGRMQTCGICKKPSYDLRQGTFHEGWHDFLPRVYEQKLQQPSTCRICKYRLICHICPGQMLLEYGDLEERPIEYLCEIARLREEAFSTGTKSGDTIIEAGK